MAVRKELVALLEYGTWCHLEQVKDHELILLKGHLILDIVLAELYGDKLSFYGKVNKLAQNDDYRIYAQMLLELNNMRNQLAHELSFDVEASGLLRWADDVLLKVDFNKHSKMTKRTKVIHAFSGLARKVISLKNQH
ncbi:hypothetical protein [Aliivibrio sp. 1S128]|uniref:hypothetical protein n=1 Tax=Aliivibrio sp. 1S128 TaxID=1840085 RepID=UPI00080EA5A3|nr:hypothetical protein [Aliivibrio sp. 1S128]OCH14596.1 hypothetical protein A6E03_16710 [Aliivibrio sp. 1S128]